MRRALFVAGENFKGKIRSVFWEIDKNKKLIWHEYNFKGLLDKVLEFGK